MGGSRAQSARKIFCYHAHFTCKFRVRELRARIFYTRPRAILMCAIRQGYAAAEQDWHSSAKCQERWK